MSVTGEIQSLGLARISVGRLACTIPSKLVLSADRFVIGDPVKITCLGGALLNVKYAPEHAIGQADGSASATSSASTHPATGSMSGFAIGVLCSGVISATHPDANSTTCTSTGTQPTSTASGPITALNASSITVGELTCSLPTGVFSLFASSFQVGQTVKLGCYTGTGQLACVSKI